MKNNFGAPKWVLLVRFFCHFLKLASLIFLDIARDCSLVECLTSSRAKTLKKKKNRGSNLGRNDLFYSSVVERPRKFASFF